MKHGVLPAQLDAIASHAERSLDGEVPDPILVNEFEDFFENAALALHFVGKDGTILRANRAELEMLGFTAEEYVGRNIREFMQIRQLLQTYWTACPGGRNFKTTVPGCGPRMARSAGWK
jgi:PAS domain-containing protein